MTRGVVVTLTPEQVVARALYLAGELDASSLDEHVRDPARLCPDIFYRLADHNGGTDPTAPDPATRWSKPGSKQVNVTCDCSGATAWCSGFDRYQPKRMRPTVGYGGWWNTDSKIYDVTRPLKAGESRCFEDVGRPEPGCILTCESGTRGHKVGHEGIVVGYRGAEWDPTRRELWGLIDVVDVARRTGRANKRTTGRGWYGTGARFVRSVMLATRSGRATRQTSAR